MRMRRCATLGNEDTEVDINDVDVSCDLSVFCKTRCPRQGMHIDAMCSPGRMAINFLSTSTPSTRAPNNVFSVAVRSKTPIAGLAHDQAHRYRPL